MARKVNKIFGYQLDPNAHQIEKFKIFSGSTRFIYNWALSERIDFYKKTGQNIFYTEQSKILTQLKKNDLLWLGDIHAQILQQSLKNLDKAFTNFFRRVKSGVGEFGFPKFKKKGQKDSFRYPQHVKMKDSKIFLPSIGWVKFHNSRPIEGKIKQATVKREADKWFVYVAFEAEIEDRELPEIKESTSVGIDVGLKNFCFISDGTSIENPRFLDTSLEKIKKVQRKLSKKTRGGQNYQKQKVKLARAHLKIRNQRKDFLQKLSTKIVKSHDLICVESLDIMDMVKKSSNKEFTRKLLDVGWGGFISMLEYKAKWNHKRFVKIDQYEPTSQTCSGCGGRKPMPLSERVYSCDSCGLVIDRDLNASLNIRAAGLAVLACGGSALAEPVKQESPSGEGQCHGSFASKT
jgi:putative transposase